MNTKYLNTRAEYLFGIPYSENIKEEWRRSMFQMHDNNNENTRVFIENINNRIINKAIGLLTVISIVAAVNAQLYSARGDVIYLMFVFLNVANLLLILPTLVSKWPTIEMFKSSFYFAQHGIDWAFSHARQLNANIGFASFTCALCLVYMLYSLIRTST